MKAVAFGGCGVTRTLESKDKASLVATFQCSSEHHFQGLGNEHMDFSQSCLGVGTQGDWCFGCSKARWLQGRLAAWKALGVARGRKENAMGRGLWLIGSEGVCWREGLRCQLVWDDKRGG